MPLKVLLVESKTVDNYSVQPNLLDRGHDVTLAHRPRRAPSMAVADWPDLIVLNTCDEFVDLEEVCRALDDTRLDFPRLIVAHDEAHNHVSGDVFLRVPFSLRQLSQRMKKAIGDQNERFLRVGDIALDRMKRQVQRGGNTKHLTPKEFTLLELLMNNSGDVLNRRTIMKVVWDTDYLGDTRTLDVHIRWLREKLEDAPSQPEYIVTVRGVGYRFSPKPR